MIDLVLAAISVLALTAPASADSNSPDCLAAKEVSANVEVNAREEAKKYAQYFDAFEAQQQKYLAKFDSEKTIFLVGAVKEFRFKSPRATLLLTVSDEHSHAEQQWVLEMNSPSRLVGLGWRPGTLVAGMPVTVSIHPMRDGTNGGQFVAVTMPDGKQMDGGHPTTLRTTYDQITAAELALAEFKQRLACDLPFSPPNAQENLQVFERAAESYRQAARLHELESVAETYRSLFYTFLTRFSTDPNSIPRP